MVHNEFAFAMKTQAAVALASVLASQIAGVAAHGGVLSYQINGQNFPGCVLTCNDMRNNIF